MDFLPLDVVVGGALGYAEHINTLGVHQQHIALRDDDGNLMKVWGACFTPEGDAFFALGQIPSYEDYTPHDICYIPRTKNPRKFAVLIGRTADTLELWITDDQQNILTKYTGLDTDAGWDHTIPTKVAVACDGRTAYYTDQGATIFKFDLSTGTQLAPFDVIDPGDPLENYIYAGIDIQPDGDLYVAVTPIVAGGVGPRRDVSLGSRTEVWVDQVNETPVKVYKRLIADFDTVVVSHEVSLDPDDTNDEVLAIAAWYSACFFIPSQVMPAT